MVVCEICKKEFQFVTASHLKYKHNITTKEYREKFPTARMINDNILPDRWANHTKILIDINCYNCGKKIKVSKYKFNNNKHHYCSVKCKNEGWGKNYGGKNHPRYGHKLTPEEKRKVSRGVYRSIRENKHGKLVQKIKNILESDGFKCYVLVPLPDMIAISKDGKVYAIEAEIKDVERKMNRWKNAEYDFNGIVIFNEESEVEYRNG